MKRRLYSHAAVEHVESGTRFRTFAAAARYIGGDRWGVKRCCYGVQHSHKGQHFRFVGRKG